MKLFHKLLGISPDDPINDLEEIEQLDLNFISDNIPTDTPTPPENVGGSIVFSILTDGNIYVNCQWNKDQSPEEYGELLYKITSGELASEIIKILMNYAKSSPSNASTVNQVLESWQNTKNSSENNPLIKPSDVFAFTQLKQSMENNSQ
jgi:hypothetical protein